MNHCFIYLHMYKVKNLTGKGLGGGVVFQQACTYTFFYVWYAFLFSSALSYAHSPLYCLLNMISVLAQCHIDIRILCKNNIWIVRFCVMSRALYFCMGHGENLGCGTVYYTVSFVIQLQQVHNLLKIM
jgi:hypothetical protein